MSVDFLPGNRPPFYFRDRIKTLASPKDYYAFKSLPPQRIPWKPEDLATIGVEKISMTSLKPKPWSILSMVPSDFSEADRLRFNIRMWAYLQEGVHSEDADKWRSILTDPDEVAWFTKKEAERVAKYAIHSEELLVECASLAPLVPVLIEQKVLHIEELAQCLAAGPDPDRWRVLMASCDPMILSYIENRGFHQEQTP